MQKHHCRVTTVDGTKCGSKRRAHFNPFSVHFHRVHKQQPTVEGTNCGAPRRSMFKVMRPLQPLLDMHLHRNHKQQCRVRSQRAARSGSKRPSDMTTLSVSLL